MERVSHRKKEKFKLSKKKKIIILIIILLVLISLGVFIALKALPVDDITNKDIEITPSTTNITGKAINVHISTKTNYDIYYYIDYDEEEDETNYYEESLDDEELENDSNNSSNTSNSVNTNSVTNNKNNSTNNISNSDSKVTIKNIENSKYSKITTPTISIENNATIYLKYGRFGKLSDNAYVFNIDNIDKTGPEIGGIETSSTDSTIKVSVTANDLGNSNLTYYFKLQNDMDYTCTNSTNTYTFTDLTENETYTIYIKVTDGFGNKSEAVVDAVASSEITTIAKKIYYIKVNLGANTVTIYQEDENGEYTDPIKAMVCSTGVATPKSGKYKTSYSYRWRELFGAVYGQYAVRIHGNILFHSVPYTRMYPDTLEYEEYDKLGTSASAGCVRLTVKDAKWIYDNVATGSYVEFYSDTKNPGPLGKPTAQKISNNKSNRNWDPTDPDERNPWNGGSGIVNKKDKPSSSSTNTTISNNTNTSSASNTTNNEIKNNTLIWGTDD